MSQEKPTHEELVIEEMMMTQGVHEDTEWCETVHHIFDHEKKEEVES